MAGAVGELRRYYGVYRATVVSTKDPLKKRRIKVLVPAIMGTTPTEWAWPIEDAALKSAVPAVSQGVWVMFESGDPSYPLWVGTFGKVVNTKKHVFVNPSTASGEYVIESKFSDGRQEVDLVETLLHMSATLVDFEQRIAQLEADMPLALQNGL